MKILISNSENLEESSYLAKKLEAEILNFEISNFSGNEKFISFINAPVQDSKIYIFHKLWPNPNDKIIELLLILDYIKSKNYEISGLIIPYLPYLRQDRELKENSAIGARMIAQIFESYKVRKIYTIDAHSKSAIKFFGDKLYNISSVNIFAKRLKDLIESEIKSSTHRHPEQSERSTSLPDWIATPTARNDYNEKMELDISSFLVLSPDQGSYIRAVELAKKLSLDCAYLNKVRENNEVRAYGLNKIGLQNFIIIDDMIDSGKTIIASLKNIAESCNNIIVCVSHMLNKSTIVKISDKYPKIKFINSTEDNEYLDEISNFINSTES
jgi:phosphoribosylpyrophosphate synthetase